MISKYLVLAVALVAITGVAAVAMELAILTQMQQEADARGCNNSVAINASQGRCLRPEQQTSDADESDNVLDEEDDE